MGRTQPLGIILLAAVSLGWSLSWPASKVALGEIDPWTSRALIVSAGGLLLLLVARLSVAVPRPSWTWLGAIALFNITCWQLFIAYGVSLMASGRAVVIAYTMPMWASVLAVFVLGEAMTGRRALALVLGAGGLVVLAPGIVAEAAGEPAGVLFMIGAAISWTLGVVMMKRVAWSVPTLVMTG